MIVKQNKVKLANEDATTRRNPYSTSGIYLTDVKSTQCRQMAENRREKKEGKKVTEKKTSTREVQLQLNIYKAFDRCINSMNSMSLSTTNKEILIQLIQQSSNNIKDAFVHIGRKLAELNNQRRDKVAREIILIMK